MIRYIIVDDEPLAREGVRLNADKVPFLEYIDDFENAINADVFLKAHEVDLIFLDIEMPILNGFELLDVLNNKPEIIFVTAKTEHAFKAFNYDAVAYLKKPLKKNLFNAAVDKAIAQIKLKKKHTKSSFL